LTHNLTLDPLSDGAKYFICILAFAVLHHLPGSDLREQVLKKAHELLQADGILIHSEWQFLNSERLKSRIIPWSQIGLGIELVEEGDYLLDWRAGGQGLRYVHHFNENEMNELAMKTGFKILETFYSDGEGGKLSLYQRWSAVK